MKSVNHMQLLRQDGIDIFNLERGQFDIFQTNKNYIKGESNGICVEKQ